MKYFLEKFFADEKCCLENQLFMNFNKYRAIKIYLWKISFIKKHEDIEIPFVHDLWLSPAKSQFRDVKESFVENFI